MTLEFHTLDGYYQTPILNWEKMPGSHGNGPELLLLSHLIKQPESILAKWHPRYLPKIELEPCPLKPYVQRHHQWPTVIILYNNSKHAQIWKGSLRTA